MFVHCIARDTKLGDLVLPGLNKSSMGSFTSLISDRYNKYALISTPVSSSKDRLWPSGIFPFLPSLCFPIYEEKFS